MAQLNKRTSEQSLNIDTSAVWDAQTRLTISAQAHVTSDVSGVDQIGIYSDSDVKFRFDGSSSDTISANNDLVIPASTLVFMKVPKGVGDTIYVHFKQVASVGSKYLALVHM